MHSELKSGSREIHKDLIELCKTGNSQAQFRLYMLYSKAMFNTCMRMMGSREEAEDVLQEAFTEAFFSIKNFRFESAFGVWLRRIVVNKCINKIRKRKVDLTFTDNIGDLEDLNDNTDNDDDNGYRVQQIMKAFELLPEGYRIIFSLYMMEGYDHNEISEILGISESTSRTQYLKARRKIKELIGFGEKRTRGMG